MSTMTGITSRPEIPWRSEWRKGFEAYMTEPKPRFARPKPVAQPKPAKVRAPRQKQVRKPRPHKMRTLCRCGTFIRRAGALYCVFCLNHPKVAGITSTCRVCGKALNSNNQSGLCRRDAHIKFVADQWAQHGPRPVCKHQADGMRCKELLYRTNTTGFCRWHVSRGYTTVGQPEMEAL